MKKLFILLLVAMVGVTSCAINKEKEIAKGIKPSSFQPKPLDDEWSKWLLGQWEGSGESDAGTGKGWSNIEFGLNGQFLIMKSEGEITELTAEQIQYLRDTLHASDEDIERFRSSTFKELQIHTIDPKTGEVIGYLFDSLRCIAEGRGKREGNKEIMEWKWSGTAQGASSTSIIERVNDNKIIVTVKYTLPDGSTMEDKGQVTRKTDVPKREEAHKVGIRFNMIGIFVNDLQKTVEFYRDVIGLEIKETAESYVEFNHNGIRFAVFERTKLPEWLGVTPAYPDGLNGTFELAIDLPYFEDVDSEFVRMVKAGAKLVMEPKDMPWGQRSAVVADPDGNFIEIGSFNSGKYDE